MLSSDRIKDAGSYFGLLKHSLSAISARDVDRIAEILLEAYDHEGTVFIFGNGGSASSASHFACDLSKGTIQTGSRKRLRAVGLTDNLPILTAWANDAGYESVFAEQIRNLIQPDDIAFAISCSGNSPNVLKALEVARAAGASTVGLGGFDGGRMKFLCDFCLIIPSENMQIIEDLHLSITHCAFTLVRNRIAGRFNQKVVAVNA